MRRRFCATCGTPVAFYSERFADEIHVYAASLDNPEGFTPEAHYFAEEALSWTHELVPPHSPKPKNRSR
ncbi:MAG: GFA family protein [Pseudomonadota bacterium]